MTNVTEFTSDLGTVRSLSLDGVPWFIGKEVTYILEYVDNSQALRKHVDSEDKLIRQIDWSGQKRNMILINEAGLYSLILSSKQDSAKQFKRWILTEVLPTIHRQGYYKTESEMGETASEELTADLSQAQAEFSPHDTIMAIMDRWKEEVTKNVVLSMKIEELMEKEGVTLNQRRLEAGLFPVPQSNFDPRKWETLKDVPEGLLPKSWQKQR